MAILDNMGQQEGFLAQFQPTRLDPRQIEDFIDQFQQVVAAGMDIGGIFLVGRDDVLAEQFVLHDLRKAENGIQRCAQFMAHRRQKPRFCQIGLFRPAAGLVGIGLGLLQLANQRILFRLECQGVDRCLVDAIGQDHEIHLCPRRQQRQRHRFEAILEIHEHDHA